MTQPTYSAVYDAALRAGCPPREALVLAEYVRSQKIVDAAAALGIHPKTAMSRLGRIYERLGVDHAAAAVAKLLA